MPGERATDFAAFASGASRNEDGRMDPRCPAAPQPVSLPTARSSPFDPPPELGRIRDRSPICRLVYPDGHVGWLVTGHELVRAILSDSRFSARAELKRVPVRRPGADPFIGQPALPGWFVDMDRPQHTRFRRLLGDALAPRAMSALQPRIEQIAERALDEMEQAGPPADLVEAYALPVPSLVICEMLGVPYSQRTEFQRNSETLFSLDVSAEEGEAAMEALTTFLLELIRHKRARPGDDLLSRLACSDELAELELAGVGVLLLTAGHETIASSLGLGAFALLCEPRKLAALRADLGLMDGAVEELLRFLTVFHFGVPRTPLEDVEIEGHLLRAGESVTLSLPAANRDPARFRTPDELNLAGSAAGHVAFGYGVHQCIGQGLARIELRIAYTALLRRFPTLRLAVAPEEVPTSEDAGIYGVHRLPVAW
jgi:cytochrome P450